MSYVIKSITSKHPGHSICHRELWIGKKCGFECFMIGVPGFLLIDVEDNGRFHPIDTTPVVACEMSEDGTIVLETVKSVYTLVKESNYRADVERDRT